MDGEALAGLAADEGERRGGGENFARFGDLLFLAARASARLIALVLKLLQSLWVLGEQAQELAHWNAG